MKNNGKEDNKFAIGNIEKNKQGYQAGFDVISRMFKSEGTFEQSTLQASDQKSERIKLLKNQARTVLALIENADREDARLVYENALARETHYKELVEPYSKLFFACMEYVSWFASCTQEEHYPQCEAALYTAHQQIKYAINKNMPHAASVSEPPSKLVSAQKPDTEPLLMYFLEALAQRKGDRRTVAAMEESFSKVIAPWGGHAGGGTDTVSAEDYRKEAQKINGRLQSYVAAYDCREALLHAMKLIFEIAQTGEDYLDAQTCCQWGQRVRTLFDGWRSTTGGELRWVDYSPELTETARVKFSLKEEHDFPALYYRAGGQESSAWHLLLHGGRREN